MITIFGLADSYELKDCALFLNSLKKLNFNGELILFSNSLKEKELLSEYSFCKLQKIPLKYHNIQYSTAVLRYFYYLDYIKENITHNDKIIFTDIRDTVFQNTNIFDHNMTEGIYLFKENKDNLISTEEWHSVWFNDLDRSDFLDPSEEKAIYCSGIQLFKNKNYAIEYLNLFCDKVSQYKKYTWKINDQPIHQLVIYEDILKSKRSLSNENNDLVFHMGLCDENEYTINEYEYEIKNFAEKNLPYSNENICLDGSIPSIIHQYDRRERAISLIENQYA